MEKHKKYEERLMDALRFDEDDLEANEAGYLSERQLKRLKSMRTSAALALIILALLFSSVFLFLASRSGSVSGALPFLGVGSLLLVVLFLVYRSRVYPLASDLRENETLASEGRIDLSLKHQQQNRIEYFVRVNEMRFRVKKETFFALKNGDPYRIYYAPRSKQILSAEWLREGDDNLLLDTEDDGSVSEISAKPDESVRLSSG